MLFCLVLDYHPDYIGDGEGSPATHTLFKADNWESAHKKAKKYIQKYFSDEDSPTDLILIEVAKSKKIVVPNEWFEYEPKYKGEKQMRTCNIGSHIVPKTK